MWIKICGITGADAVAAVGPLAERLGDSESLVRAASAHALGRVGPGAKDAVSALAAHVRSDNSDDVRREAVQALAAIGPESARLAIPALGQALQLRVDPGDRMEFTGATGQKLGRGPLARHRLGRGERRSPQGLRSWSISGHGTSRAPAGRT